MDFVVTAETSRRHLELSSGHPLVVPNPLGIDRLHTQARIYV